MPSFYGATGRHCDALPEAQGGAHPAPPFCPASSAFPPRYSGQEGHVAARLTQSYKDKERQQRNTKKSGGERQWVAEYRYPGEKERPDAKAAYPALGAIIGCGADRKPGTVSEMGKVSAKSPSRQRAEHVTGCSNGDEGNGVASSGCQKGQEHSL